MAGEEDKTGAWDRPWEQSESPVSGTGQQGEGRCVGRPGANWEGGAGLPLGRAGAALGPSEQRE